MAEPLAVDELPASGVAPDPSGTIAEIRRLVHQARLDEARELLAEVQARGAEHPDLATWARILEPPRCLPAGTAGRSGGSRDNEAWLRLHAARYLGQWVALRGGELLGSHPDRMALHRELRTKGDLTGTLFVCLVPG